MGATIDGVGADSPFALNAFREEYGRGVDPVSDVRRAAAEACGLLTDAPSYELYDVADRPEDDPDSEELLAATGPV